MIGVLPQNHYFRIMVSRIMEHIDVTVGGSFLNVLALIFIVLKIVGVEPIASWSWWWVLSPIWIPIAIVLFFAVLWGIVMAFTR